MEWYEWFYSKDFMDVVGFASEEQTREEVQFVTKALNCPKDSKILDLCCGYGRHSCLLAESGGFEVTGLDLSDDYLTIAKNRYSARNLTFMKGDMRKIPFENHFDAVINLFTSFGYFESDEENEIVIQQVSKALRVEGLFLMDYENKFYFVYNDVFQKESDRQKVGDDAFYLLESGYDAVNEREVFKATFIEQGKVKRSSGYNIRLYSYPELSKMLFRNGFEILKVWGDFQGSPYSVKSRRLITLSKKIQ
jgi:SAM-dependent methyltransferase